jgi:hypothetical protein
MGRNRHIRRKIVQAALRLTALSAAFSGEVDNGSREENGSKLKIQSSPDLIRAEKALALVLASTMVIAPWLSNGHVSRWRSAGVAPVTAVGIGIAWSLVLAIGIRIELRAVARLRDHLLCGGGGREHGGE